MNDSTFWITPNYGVPKGSKWTESKHFVFLWTVGDKSWTMAEKKKIDGQPNPICELIKARLPRK